MRHPSLMATGYQLAARRRSLVGHTRELESRVERLEIGERVGGVNPRTDCADRADSRNRADCRGKQRLRAHGPATRHRRRGVRNQRINTRPFCISAGAIARGIGRSGCMSLPISSLTPFGADRRIPCLAETSRGRMIREFQGWGSESSAAGHQHPGASVSTYGQAGTVTKMADARQPISNPKKRSSSAPARGHLVVRDSEGRRSSSPVS